MYTLCIILPFYNDNFQIYLECYVLKAYEKGLVEHDNAEL